MLPYESLRKPWAINVPRRSSDGLNIQGEVLLSSRESRDKKRRQATNIVAEQNKIKRRNGGACFEPLRYCASSWTKQKGGGIGVGLPQSHPSQQNGTAVKRNTTDGAQHTTKVSAGKRYSLHLKQTRTDSNELVVNNIKPTENSSAVPQRKI